MGASYRTPADLGRFLSQRVRDLGMTEERASELIAGHGTVFSDLKRGRWPNYGRAQKIAEVLELECYLGPCRDVGPTVHVTAHQRIAHRREVDRLIAELEASHNRAIAYLKAIKDKEVQP